MPRRGDRRGMEQDQIWDRDTAQTYDNPGTGMFAPEVLDPAVDRLAALTGDGRALEFAVGNDRVFFCPQSASRSCWCSI